MYRAYFVLAFFTSTLSFLFCAGQTPRIARLKQNFLAATDHKQKIASLFALCEERNSLSTDTLFYYASLAKSLAKQAATEKDEILADYYLANVLIKRGLFDSSMALVDRNSRPIEERKYGYDLLNKYAYLKGHILIKNNRHKEALEVFYHALANAEKSQDTLGQIVSKNSIGWVYMEMEQNRDAIGWFHKAINTAPNSPLLEKYNAVLSNLAATYNNIGKNDSAEYFINKALSFSRTQQNLQSLANALAIQADIFIDTKRSKLAEAALNEALQIRKQVADPYYIVSDMTQLAIYYAHNGQPEKGIALCEEGIRMSNEFNLSSKLSILYSALADNYKAANNYELYSNTLLKLMAVKDSVYKTASAEALADLQTKYDVQKKENIIIQQKLDLVRKNYWLYGSLIFSLLVLSSLAILFKTYRRKQQLKLQLMKEEEKRNSEKAVMIAEEAERKRIAADLHDSLGAYAASIASNIHQLEVLFHTKNSAVLQELRNNSQSIVSQLSDTIWVLKKDALLLTSISDRLKVFIQKLGPSYSSVNIDVWEDIATDYLLPPAQAFHLFQIIKEAISNALKHSDCTQITVKIEAQNTWRVRITDNGKGIPVEKLLAEAGNGLSNMKARSKESGWQIEWQLAKPSGTSVLIEP